MYLNRNTLLQQKKILLVKSEKPDQTHDPYQIRIPSHAIVLGLTVYILSNNSYIILLTLEQHSCPKMYP